MPAEGAPIEHDHLFPRYHLRPPVGYLNDPNGPILIDGTYHLYYQYRLTTDLHSPVLWGHATTVDLVRWHHHRPAITPHPTGLDRDGCWSGNTVVDGDGRVRAFYSGLRADHPYQSVLSAISTDGGFSFGAARQVVADPAPDDHVVTFRDPFVWRVEGGWHMVVGAGTRDAATVRHYRSSNLDAWDYLGPLVTQPRRQGAGTDTGTMWECPQIVHAAPPDDPGTRRPFLLFGAWTRTDGTMRAYTAAGLTLDEHTDDDTSLTITPIDAGPDFYAPSVLRTTSGQPLLWGWVREARDHDWCVEQGWSGTISLPRLLSGATDTGLLLQAPPALAGLRDGRARSLDLHHSTEGQLELLSAQQELDINVAGSTTLLLAFGPHESLHIQLDPERDELCIDHRNASRDPRATGGIIVVKDAFTNCTGTTTQDAAGARIYLDGSVMEIFTSSGRTATLRYYPTTPPPYRLSAQGGPASLQVWQLSARPVSDIFGGNQRIRAS